MEFSFSNGEGSSFRKNSQIKNGSFSFNKSEYALYCINFSLEPSLWGGSGQAIQFETKYLCIYSKAITEFNIQINSMTVDEKLDAKYSHFQMKSIADYEQLKRVNNARSKTQSRFVRGELMDNVREYSNGESAYRYFTEKIGENGLYLLDEPENSLSPKRQMELTGFIEDSVRFFGCQFIISTHSPFLLAMRGAKIYDLDENPVGIKRWTELENIRMYHEFFKLHHNEF